MRHHLLLMLGKGGYLAPDHRTPVRYGPGQAPPPTARAYGRATYALAGAPGATVETPFVGEALVRLHAGTFTDVHLFGTADVMWNVLHAHLLGRLDRYDDADAEADDALTALIGSSDLVTGHPLLDRLGRLFVDAFRADGVHRCTCHVLPLPTSDAALWASLRTVATAVDDAGRARVSIDLTHGLRIQPFFLFLATAFLRETRPRLQIADAFYGALELTPSEGPGRGVTDILRVTALLDALDWLDAARSFRRYGDATLVGTRLPSGPARAFAAFGQALQTNALARLDALARTVVRETEGIPQVTRTVPLDLLEDALLDLPRKLSKAAPWRAKAHLAVHHARAQNVGLAVIAASEAILDRVAAAYDVTPTERGTQETVAMLKTAVLGELPKATGQLASLTIRTRVGEVGKVTRVLASAAEVPLSAFAVTLTRVRNAIAHADERTRKVADLQNVAAHLIKDNVFAQLLDALGDPAWARLPEVVTWEALAAAAAKTAHTKRKGSAG